MALLISNLHLTTQLLLLQTKAGMPFLGLALVHKALKALVKALHMLPKWLDVYKRQGLKKLNSSVVQEDTPDIMGKVHKISHLLKVEEA